MEDIIMIQVKNQTFNSLQSNITSELIGDTLRTMITFVITGQYSDIIENFTENEIIYALNDNTQEIEETYDFPIPGPVIDNRDGTFSVTMYALTENERRIKELEARIAELEG